MDPFVKAGATWIRTLEEPRPVLLTTRERKESGKRWIVGELPDKRPRSVDSYGKFGVYAYGKTNLLLHYYARELDVATHEDLHELARAEHLTLDIVPHDHRHKMQLKVIWRGKPAAGRMIYVRGPKGFQQNLKTSDQGVATFSIKNEGQDSFRTYVEEKKAGQEAGKEYSLIRHHATMRMRLPLES